jgi:alkyl hydroperoxide reductase subunit AhpC
LCARQEEFKQLYTRVFIISFGTLPAIQQWMKETCSSIDVLMDRDRTVYKSYQLERSRLKSKSPRILWLYFTYWLQGRKFHDSHGDDTSQLGGDFIIDKDRFLRFVHPSQDPVDRPPVDDLLKVLRNL